MSPTYNESYIVIANSGERPSSINLQTPFYRLSFLTLSGDNNNLLHQCILMKV